MTSRFFARLIVRLIGGVLATSVIAAGAAHAADPSPLRVGVRGGVDEQICDRPGQHSACATALDEFGHDHPARGDVDQADPARSHHALEDGVT